MEQTPPPAQPKPKPDYRRPVILTVAVLVLIALLYWSAGFREYRARREVMRKGVDAVAAALAPSVVVRGNDLNFRCEQIRIAGGYSKVTITDKDGKVIGSSDKQEVGTQRELPKTIPIDATHDGDTITRGIGTSATSDTWLGVLIVQAKE